VATNVVANTAEVMFVLPEELDRLLPDTLDFFIEAVSDDCEISEPV
jgi:hypothetical protein